MLNVLFEWNVDFVMSKPFPTGFLSSMDTTIIRIDEIRNTRPIRSRKGIIGNPILIIKDITSEARAVVIAALEVARFQKKPKINIATIPGLTNPVKSCIY